MRLAILSLLAVGGMLLGGCGDGGGSSTQAAAGGGGAPPPPPGGAPAASGVPVAPDAPATPGDANPPENPPPAAEGGNPATPPGGGEGTPLPPPGEGALPANPGAEQPPAIGTPDGTPPGDGGTPGQPEGGNPDGTPRPPPPPKTLHEQAIAAFRAGNELAGYKFLTAHYAIMPQAKAELVKKMAWYPALVRPALAPRIGIAVHLAEESKDFTGDPMPIGSASLTAAVDQMQQAEQANTRIGGDGNSSKFRRKRPMVSVAEGGTGDAARNLSGAEQLTYYTGDFGDRLMDALLDGVDAGDYGTVIRELYQQASRPRQRAADPNNPGQPPGGDPASNDAGPGASDAPGEGAPSGRGRLAKGRGGPGGGGTGAVGGPTGLPGEEPEGRSRRFTARADSQDSVNLQQIRQIEPYIIWLGKESERSVITKRAEAASVDVLAIFELTLRPFRNGNGTNSTYRLRLFATKGNKPIPIKEPESLVNLDVEKWRQKNTNEKATDPVDREVLKVIEALNSVLKPVPLPEGLTAERVRSRIEELVAEKPAEPFRVLVEARFYVAKGLLPEAELEKAAVALLGDAGYAKLKARIKDDSE